MKRMTGVWAGVVLLMGLLMHPVHATDHFTLQSQYLGAGWFQYDFTVGDDPFFPAVYFASVYVGVSNSAWAECTQTNDMWTRAPNQLTLSNATSVLRPFHGTLVSRSSCTNYRLATDGATAMGIADVYEEIYNGVVELSVAYYCRMEALVPCPPEEADGAAPSHVSTFVSVPDVAVTGFSEGMNGARQLEFTWGADSTVRIQGSADMSTWTNLGYALGNSGPTLWTLPTDLPATIRFFRVALVAQSHIPELLSGSPVPLPPPAPQSAAPGITPRLVPLPGGDMQATFPTAAGLDYKVTVRSITRSITWSHDVTGDGNEATIVIPGSALGSGGFVEVDRL